MIRTPAICVIVVAVVSAACTSPLEDDWADAKSRNTVKHFNLFLFKYPDSEYESQARDAIVDLEFDRAVNDEDRLASLTAFNEKYPGSAYEARALELIVQAEFNIAARKSAYRHEKLKEFRRNHPGYSRLEELGETDWESAKHTDTLTAYEEYCLCHPDSKNAVLAGKEIERIIGAEWSAAKKDENVRAIEEFIRKYRTSSSISSELLARAECELAWKKADKYKTEKGYLNFLQEYGESEHASEAGSRLEDLVWAKAAKKENRIDLYRDYLARFPGGRYGEPAGEYDMWAKIEDGGSPAGMSEYLEKYPQGKFVDRARFYLENSSNPSLDDKMDRSASTVLHAMIDWVNAPGSGCPAECRELGVSKIDVYLYDGFFTRLYDEKTKKTVNRPTGKCAVVGRDEAGNSVLEVFTLADDGRHRPFPRGEATMILYGMATGEARREMYRYALIGEEWREEIIPFFE